jgi:DNA-binding transcriptional ArsR family regulator
MNTEAAANAMDALGAPVRLEIYRLLIRAGATGMTITRIQQKTGIARSTLSHHLHRLIEGGLVSTEKSGASLICRADYTAMNTLVGFLSDKCCVDESIAQGGEAA